MKKLLLFTFIIFLCSGQQVFAQERPRVPALLQGFFGQPPSAQTQQRDPSPTPTQTPSVTPTPSPSPSEAPTPTPTKSPQPTPTATPTPEPPSPSPTEPQPTPTETPPPGIPVVQVKPPTPTPDIESNNQQNDAQVSDIVVTRTPIQSGQAPKPVEDPITKAISPPLGALLSHIPKTLYDSATLNPIQTVSLITLALSIFSFGLILIEEDILMQGGRIAQWYRTVRFRAGRTFYISHL